MADNDWWRSGEGIRHEVAQRAEITERITRLKAEYVVKFAEADAVLLALGRAYLDLSALDGTHVHAWEAIGDGSFDTRCEGCGTTRRAG